MYDDRINLIIMTPGVWYSCQVSLCKAAVAGGCSLCPARSHDVLAKSQIVPATRMHTSSIRKQSRHTCQLGQSFHKQVREA